MPQLAAGAHSQPHCLWASAAVCVPFRLEPFSALGFRAESFRLADCSVARALSCLREGADAKTLQRGLVPSGLDLVFFFFRAEALDLAWTSKPSSFLGWALLAGESVLQSWRV